MKGLTHFTYLDAHTTSLSGEDQIKTDLSYSSSAQLFCLQFPVTVGLFHTTVY